jgi:hypothetical protein
MKDNDAAMALSHEEWQGWATACTPFCFFYRFFYVHPPYILSRNGSNWFDVHPIANAGMI